MYGDLASPPRIIKIYGFRGVSVPNGQRVLRPRPPPSPPPGQIPGYAPVGLTSNNPIDPHLTAPIQGLDGV